MDVIHTAIWVEDMDAAREFFVEGLGLEENWSFTADGIENVYVGGEHGEIQLRTDTEHDTDTADRETLDHIAVSVDDVQAETERVVEKTGCSVLEGPVVMEKADAHVSFIQGPDGYVVELVESL